MAAAAGSPAGEVAVIVGCPREEALLREQHLAYGEEAAACSSSSSSSLLQQADFLGKNAAAIEANSGDYTSWYLRRRYLSLNPKHLNEDELRYCREVCFSSLKNYQAWFHRQWLLRRLPVSSFSLQEEKDSIKETLGMDLKNYNTWAYKSVMLDVLGLSLKEETEETEEVLRIDPFSNSAFAYLFSLLKRQAQQLQQQQQQVLSLWTTQIQRYTLVFEKQPSNEALLRFLLGCLKAAAAAATEEQQQQLLLQETLGLLLGTAARIVAAGEGGERLGLEAGVAIDCLQQNYKAAAAKCMRLKEADPIRRFYWSWKAMLFGKQEIAMNIVS